MLPSRDLGPRSQHIAVDFAAVNVAANTDVEIGASAHTTIKQGGWVFTFGVWVPIGPQAAGWWEIECCVQVAANATGTVRQMHTNHELDSNVVMDRRPPVTAAGNFTRLLGKTIQRYDDGEHVEIEGRHNASAALDFTVEWLKFTWLAP